MQLCCATVGSCSMLSVRVLELLLFMFFLPTVATVVVVILRSINIPHSSRKFVFVPEPCKFSEKSAAIFRAGRALAGSVARRREFDVGIRSQSVVTLVPPCGCTSVLFQVQESTAVCVTISGGGEVGTHARESCCNARGEHKTADGAYELQGAQHLHSTAAESCIQYGVIRRRNGGSITMFRLPCNKRTLMKYIVSPKNALMTLRGVEFHPQPAFDSGAPHAVIKNRVLR